jgi:hypothetical protein
MTRPFHDIVFAAVDAAPVWDWSSVGVDVPQHFFDGLVAEGMGGAYTRHAGHIERPCGIVIHVYTKRIDGPADEITVHCQMVDVSTRQLTAHQRLALAAARAEQVAL